MVTKPESPHAWVDRVAEHSTPQTSVVNGMRWTPPDVDADVEQPPWSWLAPSLTAEDLKWIDVDSRFERTQDAADCPHAAEEGERHG